MSFQYFAGAAYRALTAGKDGPSLYDVCDPAAVATTAAATRILANSTGRRWAIRRCGRCCAAPGFPNCPIPRACERSARPDAGPATTLAGLGGDRPADRRTDRYHRARPSQASPISRRRRPAERAEPRPDRARDPRLRRASAARRIAKRGFIPTYAAFNLIGDADMRGRELLMALTRPQFARLQELDAAVQPGAHLHRPFAGARADQPALAGHRRADVGADADPPSLRLLRCVLHRGAAASSSRPGLPRRDRDRARRAARSSDMVDFCLAHQPRGSALA